MRASWRSATAAAAKGRERLTLLLVGEIEPFLDFHSSVLRRNQIRIETCATGPEALNRVQGDGVDVVFVDERPDPSRAWQLVDNLKSLPMTEDVPVVLVASPHGRHDGADRPAADALLSRPFREGEFLSAIRRFAPLRERRHRRYPVNLRFAFRANGRGGQAFSRVVSHSGAFLKTDRLMPVGTRIELSFRLPGEEEPIRCGGVVRNTVEWGVDPSVTPGFGVEFEELDEGDDHRLAAFLGDLHSIQD